MKQRLDIRITEKGLAISRQRARAMIMAGKVLVNQKPAEKAGMLVSDEDVIILRSGDIPYVSRGGLKLEAALSHLNISVDGKICMDVGASTGGFTDCLLQHGARQVYAVDVGYGQLAWKLRQHPNVIAIERTNIRNLDAERIPTPIDLVTIDASFISLKIVVPVVLKWLAPEAVILPLIKPQFEVGKGRVGKGGVVKDASLHDDVLKTLTEFFRSIGLSPSEPIESPILGPKGNKEFFIKLIYKMG